MKISKLKSLLILISIVSLNYAFTQTPLQVAGTANKTATTSGNWNSTATWGGTLPVNDDRVLIPSGVTVTVNSKITEEFKSVRIADGGTLQFAENVNTELRTEYLFSSMMGTLQIGTITNKIANDVTASLVFAERGGTTSTEDSQRYAPGAVLMGPTTMHGQDKTSWLTLSTQPSAGATQFVLASAPIGWEIGDKIVVAGTDPITNASITSPSEFERDEVVTITNVSGSTVTFAPALIRDHKAPAQASDLNVHVANLSRNIIISSENTSVTSLSGDFQKPRGHLMFMHNLNVDLRYVEANNLGRTDKQIILDDWDFTDLDANQNTGSNVTNGLRNPRGRYSIHFHRGGLDTSIFPAKPIIPLPTPAHVEGCVVNTDPGWGYVSHSARVDFIKNVSYNVVGGAFNTESGNETGSFIENIAIRTVNPSNPVMTAPRPRNSYTGEGSSEVPTDALVDKREGRQDFAWQGDAFWFHGTGVTVQGNVASGCTGHAFVYWTEGLIEKGLGMARGDIDAHVPASEFPKQNASLHAWKTANPNFVLDVWYLQPRPFLNNTAYGFARGVQNYYTHTEFHRRADPSETDPNAWINDLPNDYKDQLQFVVDGVILWNIGRTGFSAETSANITIQNSRIVGYNSRTGYENYGTNPSPAYINDEPEVIGIDLDYYHNTHRWIIQNNIVEGFSGNSVAISLPKSGQSTINGGTFNNAGEDIRINAAGKNFENIEGEGFGVGMLSVAPTKASVLIQGNVTFSNPNNNIVMDAEIIYDEIPGKGFPMIAGRKLDPLFFFAPMEVTLNFGPFSNVSAYFNEQDSTYIPIVSGGNNCAISESSACVASQYVGKTNAQLNTNFSNSFLGSITPNSAVTHAIVVGGKINGATLGIEDIDFSQEIEVFPNPSKTGILNIKTTQSQTIEKISMYSLTGKLLFETNRIKSNSINLNNFSSGMYLLKIDTSDINGTLTKKIIIE